MSHEDEEYLVRGALLKCNCGSHPRRLNLPQCHGVYVLDHPVISEYDCVPENNISYFGVCQAETPPSGSEEILLDEFVQEEQQSTGKEVQGLRCVPEIHGKWENTNKATKISGNGTAVTTNSYLVCTCGGLIEPVTSGKECED